MPNYSIVVDSTFKPFTYQELTAPLDRAEAYHEKLAQEYDNLSSQADILEAMGKDDKDNKTGAYSRYKAYSDALRKEAEDLYRYGLNVESRRRLSDMRRAYNTDIVPIQNAWSKRIKEQEAQQTAEINNPLLRFSRKAADTDIDYYVNNPMGGYDVVNLESVYKTAANMYKSLAKLKREGKLEKIDPYTNNFVREYGVDPALIADWMNNPSKDSILTTMMNQALSTNGLDNGAFAKNGVLDEAKAFAKAAAWEAVGESKEQLVDNYYNKQMLASNLRIREKQQENAGNGTGVANWFNFQQDSIPLAVSKDGQPAGYVNGFWQHYPNDSWNGKARTMRVQEVKGADENGKMQLKSDIITLGDLIRKNPTYNPNGEELAVFYMNQDNQQGYLFQVNGKRYFADISTDMNPDVRNARESFSAASQAVLATENLKQQLLTLNNRTDMTAEEKQKEQAKIIQAIQEANVAATNATTNGISKLGGTFNTGNVEGKISVTNQPTPTQLKLLKSN